MLWIILFLAAVFLAYSNGANDNFKGVATLYGCKAVSYRSAITLATIATFAGSICSIFLADQLVSNFSGKGLVPDSMAGTPEFLLSVALGAGTTVLLATLLGYPISTTHSLTGALVGAGVISVGSAINLSVLGNKFFLPLLISPFIALVLGGSLYFICNRLRQWFRLDKELCVCIGGIEKTTPLVGATNQTTLMQAYKSLDISVDNIEHCTERYTGAYMGIKVQSIMDFFHYISASMVSFARGLNDTPKIVALLLAINALDIKIGLLSIGVAMAIGGILNARKVAETMSNKITDINHGQGLAANLVTGFLVIFASRMGVPVSTTHVSVGSIFGIGLTTKQADNSMVLKILASWLITLPVAAICAGLSYAALQL